MSAFSGPFGYDAAANTGVEVLLSVLPFVVCVCVCVLSTRGAAESQGERFEELPGFSEAAVPVNSPP